MADASGRTTKQNKDAAIVKLPCYSATKELEPVFWLLGHPVVSVSSENYLKVFLRLFKLFLHSPYSLANIEINPEFRLPYKNKPLYFEDAIY